MRSKCYVMFKECSSMPCDLSTIVTKTFRILRMQEVFYTMIVDASVFMDVH